MRSLFLRIFLWFWLVMAAVIAVLVALSPYWTHSNPALTRWEQISLEHLAERLDRAAEQGGAEDDVGKPARGRRRGRREHARVFAFSASGEPVGDGLVPPSVTEVVREVVASGEPSSRREGFHLVAARPAVLASGATGIMAAAAPAVHPPPNPLELFGARTLLLRLAAVMLVVGVLCWWLSRYLTSPLGTLRAAVGRLASGDLSARAGGTVVARHDEIGQLGRDFDTMAGRLEDLVDSHRRLLRDVSHELRSPLARLGVAVELARSKEGAAAEEALDRVEREASRLDGLIGQLLLLERLQARDDAGERQPVALDELLRQVVEDATFETRSQGAQVRMGAIEACTLLGSESLLRSAFDNVVRNAIRWSGDGTEVEVRLEVDGGRAAVVVEDRGPGIPEEALARVFEPFYRTEDARDRRRGGAGLGLAIAARAVETHGGSIRASNRASGGLTVTIHLPTAPVQA